MENDKSCASSKMPKVSDGVRCKPVERNQLWLRSVDVEKLVGKQHPVRAIWEWVGQLDLEAFYAEIGAWEGEAGRPVWDPKVLISLWIYADKDGVSLARKIAGLCQYHPDYQWLTGMEVVNYHTLADCKRGKLLLPEVRPSSGERAKEGGLLSGRRGFVGDWFRIKQVKPLISGDPRQFAQCILVGHFPILQSRAPQQRREFFRLPS